MNVYVVYGGCEVVAYICKTCLCTPRKVLRGAKNDVTKDGLEFQRYPSRLLSGMVKCIFIH